MLTFKDNNTLKLFYYGKFISMTVFDSVLWFSGDYFLPFVSIKFPSVAENSIFGISARLLKKPTVSSKVVIASHLKRFSEIFNRDNAVVMRFDDLGEIGDFQFLQFFGKFHANRHCLVDSAAGERIENNI